MTSTKEELTIFGHEFYVSVEENSDERSVKFIDKEQYETEMHSYVIHKDIRKSSDGGLFKEEKELPPRGEHVAQATHKGIQKWLRYESRERGFEKEVADAIEKTAEFWRQEFGKAEDFKDL